MCEAVASYTEDKSDHPCTLLIHSAIPSWSNMVLRTHAQAQARDFQRYSKIWDDKAGVTRWDCVCGELLQRSKPKGWLCPHKTGEWQAIDPRTGLFRRGPTIRQAATGNEDGRGRRQTRGDPESSSAQSSTSRATAAAAGTRENQASVRGGKPGTTLDGHEFEAGELRESFSTFTASGNPRPRDMPSIASARVRYAAAHQPNRDTQNETAQTEREQTHDCPCHNVDMCVTRLRAVASAPGVSQATQLRCLITAEKARVARRCPRMTWQVLEDLFPEGERVDDYDLLCHRVIQDEDQGVHEAFPYAFFLNGWPRGTGDYYHRLNRLAKQEDMDVVERHVDMLLDAHRARAASGERKVEPDVIFIDD